MAEGRYRVRRSVGPVPAELLALDAVLADGRARVLQESPRATVAALVAGGAELIVKRFREGTAGGALEALVLGSRAARADRAAARLRAAGFAVPEIVAVLERRRLGVPARSCTVARRVAGARLDELWAARHGAARRRLTTGFADWLRRLHGAGFYPQDLRAANVLVAGEDPPAFVLVDLDRVRRYRRLRWRRRRKNVVQVLRSVGRAAPRSERVRFLRRYLGTADRGALRRAAGELLRLGARKDAEYASRRRRAARRAEGPR
jgi:hypothetical protein